MFRLLLADGVRLAAAGVGMGIVVALVLPTGLKTYLFGISPADTMTLGAMVAVVLGITPVTCWIPARRAAQMDPLVALRSE